MMKMMHLVTKTRGWHLANRLRCHSSLISPFHDSPRVARSSSKLENLRESFIVRPTDNSLASSNDYFVPKLVAALRKNELKTFRAIFSEAKQAKQVNCNALNTIILDLIETRNLSKAILIVQACEGYEEGVLDGRVCSILLDEMIAEQTWSGVSGLARYMIRNDHPFNHESFQFSHLITHLLESKVGCEDVLGMCELLVEFRREKLAGLFAGCYSKVVKIACATAMKVSHSRLSYGNDVSAAAFDSLFQQMRKALREDCYYSPAILRLSVGLACACQQHALVSQFARDAMHVAIEHNSLHPRPLTQSPLSVTYDSINKSYRHIDLGSLSRELMSAASSAIPTEFQGRTATHFWSDTMQRDIRDQIISRPGKDDGSEVDDQNIELETGSSKRGVYFSSKQVFLTVLGTLAELRTRKPEVVFDAIAGRGPLLAARWLRTYWTCSHQFLLWGIEPIAPYPELELAYNEVTAVFEYSADQYTFIDPPRGNTRRLCRLLCDDLLLRHRFATNYDRLPTRKRRDTRFEEDTRTDEERLKLALEDELYSQPVKIDGLFVASKVPTIANYPTLSQILGNDALRGSRRKFDGEPPQWKMIKSVMSTMNEMQLCTILGQLRPVFVQCPSVEWALLFLKVLHDKQKVASTPQSFYESCLTMSAKRSDGYAVLEVMDMGVSEDLVRIDSPYDFCDWPAEKKSSVVVVDGVKRRNSVLKSPFDESFIHFSGESSISPRVWALAFRSLNAGRNTMADVRSRVLNVGLSRAMFELLMLKQDIHKSIINPIIAREVVLALCSDREQELSVVDLLNLIAKKPDQVTATECYVMSFILMRRLGYLGSWTSQLVHKPFSFKSEDYLIVRPNAISNLIEEINELADILDPHFRTRFNRSCSRIHSAAGREEFFSAIRWNLDENTRKLQHSAQCATLVNEEGFALEAESARLFECFSMAVIISAYFQCALANKPADAYFLLRDNYMLLEPPEEVRYRNKQRPKEAS